MSEFIEIDGSVGEGGGQILRTALGLSIATQKPFRMRKIRAGRQRPGLMRQHLTAVKAAQEVGCAEVTGASIGSMELTFRPGASLAGEFRAAVGTAGSATLVFQTVLPALLTQTAPSRLVLEGGTHNPFAPPFDFIRDVFAPVLRDMGIEIDCRLERHGFFPAGGGAFTVDIRPSGRVRPIEILERGAFRSRSASATLSRIPHHIGEREVECVQKVLGWSKVETKIEIVENSPGPGNIVTLAVRHENITELATGFGEKGRQAERVVGDAIASIKRYLDSDAPVGEHLADQLVIPFALAGAGAYRTLAPSKHLLTNIDVVRSFLPTRIAVLDEPGRDTKRIVFGG